jgi:hypothetical protein
MLHCAVVPEDPADEGIMFFDFDNFDTHPLGFRGEVSNLLFEASGSTIFVCLPSSLSPLSCYPTTATGAALDSWF